MCQASHFFVLPLHPHTDSGLGLGAKIGLSITVFGCIVLILIVVCLMRRVKTERKFRKSHRRNQLYLFEKGNVGQLNPDCTADEQAELLPYDQEWEVPKKDIRIGNEPLLYCQDDRWIMCCTEIENW